MHLCVTISCCEEVAHDHVSLIQQQLQFQKRTKMAKTSQHALKKGTASSSSLLPDPSKKGVKVYYINLEKSTERRMWMEDHLKKIGVPFERFPALTFNHTGGEYMLEDIPKLQEAFGHFSCGPWRCLDANDFACCRGLSGGAAFLTIHYDSFGNTTNTLSPVTTMLGNLASHMLVFKRIAQDYAHGMQDPVIVMEDDAVLKTDWNISLADAETLMDDWDILKLYNYHVDGCDSKVCTSKGQCVVKANRECQPMVTTALLVNPASAHKVLSALEDEFKGLFNAAPGAYNGLVSDHSGWSVAQDSDLYASCQGKPLTGIWDIPNSPVLYSCYFQNNCLLYGALRFSVDVLLRWAACHDKLNLFAATPHIAFPNPVQNAMTTMGALPTH